MIFFEVCYLGFTLYFLIKELNRLRKERLKYFKEFWSLLEFVTLALSVTTIVMYAMKKVFGTVAINALHESGSGEDLFIIIIHYYTCQLVIRIAQKISSLRFRTPAFKIIESNTFSEILEELKYPTIVSVCFR